MERADTAGTCQAREPTIHGLVATAAEAQPTTVALIEPAGRKLSCEQLQS